MSTADDVSSAIAMAGLLWVPHPQCGHWQTTRALAPEIVAFTNQQVAPAFDRLAIEFHEAGIADENGYVPSHDEYRVIAHDRGRYGTQPAEGVHKSRTDAIEAVAEIMEAVADRRN